MELDIAEIVEKATRDVLTRIQGKTGQVLVFAAHCPIGLQGLLQIVKKEYPAHRINLFLPGATQMELPWQEENVTWRDLENVAAINRLLNDFDAVFLLAPSLKLLETIAGLNDTDFIPYIVFHSLLQKKRTCLATGWNYSGPVNALEKRFDGLLKTVREIGIEILDQGTELENPGRLLNKTGDLITEVKIVELWEEGMRVLRCPKGSVVTALAYDKARELGLKISLES